MKERSINKGFTLIELIIALVIIAFLVVMVIVAIRPGERLAEARNSQRTTHVESIYAALERAIFQEGTLPESCLDTTASDVIDCENNLVPHYLQELPMDPSCGEEGQSTGYLVKKDETTGNIGVKADCAEREREIEAGHW